MTKKRAPCGDSENGRRAAEESRKHLDEAMRGADMVFITAGMGGATGTGAAPVVAEVAKESGGLAIAVVTRPFAFEGSRCRQQAEEGIERLGEKVDTLVVVPGDGVLALLDSKASVADACRTADDILRKGIQAIVELITTPGLINVVFPDVRELLGESGLAVMGTGRAIGDGRAVAAASAALRSPLLDANITGATRVLFSVRSSGNLGIKELEAAARVLAEAVDPGAEIVFGTGVDPSLGDEVTITFIATGFGGVRKMRVRQLPDQSGSEPTGRSGERS